MQGKKLDARQQDGMEIQCSCIGQSRPGSGKEKVLSKGLIGFLHLEVPIENYCERKESCFDYLVIRSHIL
jgi:hypothetical protein